MILQIISNFNKYSNKYFLCDFFRNNANKIRLQLLNLYIFKVFQKVADLN